MRLSYVVIAVAVMGCGGGGGDGYPTGNNGNGSGTGTGTGSGTGPASATATVSTRQSDDGYGTAVFAFSPQSVAITVGGTVTWSNAEGGVAHNVTFAQTAGAPSNVANFSSGSQTRTFGTRGSFAYQCTNHAGMAGQVVVQ